MLKIVRRLKPGEIAPPFYGIAHRDWVSNDVLVAPVPLNIVIYAAVNLWAFLRWGYLPISLNPRQAFDQGYRKGKGERNAQD